MRVIPLMTGGKIYTSNVYLVLGDWNRLEDVNTLVDVGRDPSVLDHLRTVYTGVGKKKVDVVMLTHSHYDHVEFLPKIRAAYAPQVWALSRNITDVDRVLDDGERIVLGDQTFEVIAIHGHTADSMCLYNELTGVLFSGDAPLLVNSGGGSYEPDFTRALEGLCRRNVRIIYPGHGKPITENCDARLRASLEWTRVSAGQFSEPIEKGSM